MKESKAITGEPEGLCQPPHILPQLIDTVAEKLYFSSAEQTQRWQHLAECVYCQALLGTYLLEVIDREEEQESSRLRARQLLARLTGIMHRTLAADIPAYAETLVAQGDERARRQFPLLIEHMHTCPTCRSEARNLQTWLQYLEQTGPLPGTEEG